MARPRGGEWLQDEVRGLAAHRVDVMVSSLLSDSEVVELDLKAEERLARAAGIDFRRLPTPDLQLPDPEGARGVAERLCQSLGDGRHVAIHCRAGIGRSSTLAALVLVLEGMSPPDAWQRIEQARGMPVPDTAAQRSFVDRFWPEL